MAHGVEIAPPRPNEFLPDPRRPAIQDIQERNQYFSDTLETSHASLAVSDTQTVLASELMRIRSVEVAGVTGGTVTVQIQVDGRDVFLDANRPVSDEAAREPGDIYNFPPGTVVSSVIEATSGTPAGEANVLIDVEVYVPVSQTQLEKLKGRDRLRPSKRRRRKLTELEPRILEASLRRFNAGIGSGTAGEEESGGGGGGGGGGGSPTPDIIASPPGVPRPPTGGSAPRGSRF